MVRVVPSQVVRFIDTSFSHVSRREIVRLTIGHLGLLQGLVRLVDEIPTELITLPAEIYTDYVLGRSMIEAYIALWTSGGKPDHYIPLPKNRDVVSVIREALCHCPDEIPSPQTNELLFVEPADLRDSIRLDVSAANQALLAGEWKASTVLAGAAIEALLLWRLEACVSSDVAAAAVALGLNAKSGRLDEQHLDWLIKVSAELNLLKGETPTSALLAKDFRNLIHPGREKRRGMACDRGTALNALGALEHVVRDLSGT